MMPMMQQGFVQPGGPPPGYAMQPQGNWQPAQHQPAFQAGRSYASNDRLPAMPEMMRRPAATQSAGESRQPLVRGGAPEQASRVPQNPPVTQSSPGWTPIRIPTPSELGILTSQSKTRPASNVELPERYDMATVTGWLDRVGARSCLREKLPEGVHFVCSFSANEQAIMVRGNTDEEALQRLVQEVVRRQQATTLSRR